MPISLSLKPASDMLSADQADQQGAVHQTPVGGSFAGKDDITQGMLVLLALKRADPARVYTRGIDHHDRQAAPVEHATWYGLEAERRHLASEIGIVYDGCAYGRSIEGLIREGAKSQGGIHQDTVLSVSACRKKSAGWPAV